MYDENIYVLIDVYIIEIQKYKISINDCINK